MVDIGWQILSFQTVYDMTISLNLMMLKIDLACWGEHARCNFLAGGIWRLSS